MSIVFFFFFQAEDGIRDLTVTGVQTCALPISTSLTSRTINSRPCRKPSRTTPPCRLPTPSAPLSSARRSEEHTSELQSQSNLVCRLLLEKKKRNEPSVRDR